MRVTSNTFSNALINQLGSLNQRQTRLHTQAATGQRVQTADDDPAAMQRTIDLQAEASSVAQFQKNVTRQGELANATYGVVKSLKTISDRANEIATLADGLKSPAELKAYADEVTQLIKQGVQLANTKNRGDFLFAGTKSDQPPFVMTTDANGVVTDVSYQGNESLAATEIDSGVTITSQIVGASSGGQRGLVTDTNSGADLFSHLISLQSHLQAGDVTAIANTDRPGLLKDEDNILFHVGQNGAVQSRLETTQAILRDRGTDLQSQVSHETEADLAETLVRLSDTQNAYQAALQSGAKIMNMSLMDYLR